jgi:preprotein translocase subunit SecF
VSDKLFGTRWFEVLHKCWLLTIFNKKEENVMLDLMGKRYWYFIISAIIIIIGIIVMAVWGLPLSIDFKGGTLLEIQFASGKTPEPAQVYTLYQSFGISNVQAYASGGNTMMIRSSVLTQDQQKSILSAIEKKFNDKVTILTADTVGPTVSQQVTSRAFLAILLSSLALVAFITYSFRGVQHAIRYGICTVIALIHDVLIILTVVAIGGHLFGWQVDTLYLTALLTVIAFSAQDTIVVFDRLRENSAIYRRLNFEKLTNHSVVQTLTRSINTQLMTVDFMLLALAMFGGITLREFAIALLIGMVSGSYSSDFIAAPLLIVWENQEWKTWFHRSGEITAA